MKQRKRFSMTTQIMAAVGIGLILGLFLPEFSQHLKIIGDIFLKLMQMAIPLLVLGQIIQAVGNIKLKELTHLGGKTILVFGISSLLAACWGILFAFLLSPGAGIDSADKASAAVQVQEISLQKTILSFFTNNIFTSLSEGSIVQIIVFALFFGLAFSKYKEEHPITKFETILLEFNEIILGIIHLVMFFAPLGITALIASAISDLGISIILPLLKYLLTYALATLSFLLLWLIVLLIFCQLNPIRLMKKMKAMSLMALATTSSAVTLPTALTDVQKKIGVSKRVANLVLTLGMALNSNGSAMHMALTVVTIAQLYKIEYNLQTLFYLAVLATFVSLANAVVPGAGLVSLAIIVPQMNLPIASIAIFASVEWFVGMLRTILNVNSDVFSAIIVGKSVGELDEKIFDKP